MSLKAYLSGSTYYNTITLVRNSYNQTISLQALDSGGNAVNLTGNTSVTFVVRALGNSTTLLSQPCTVDTATSGLCHYVTQSTDFITEGIYYGELIVAYSSGSTRVKDLIIVVVDENSPTVNAYCSATDVNNFLEEGFDYNDTSVPTLAQVNAFVIRASRHIDIASGHDWLSHTVTNELYDGKDGARLGLIELKNKPVTAVTQVSYWNGSTGWNTNTFQGQASDPANTNGWPNYFVYTPVGTIRVKGFPVVGNQVYQVSYTYGYTSVPDDVSGLCARMAALDVILTQTLGEISQFQVATLRLVFSGGYEYGIQEKLLQNGINRDLAGLRRILTAAG